MLGILTINAAGFRNLRKKSSGRRPKTTGANCSVLNVHNCSSTRARKSVDRKSSQQIRLKLELKSACLILAAVVVFSGAFYLFQVNSLTAKGYELKELQNNLAILQETNKKNRIQEVELMSMYNIEKFTENLNLVDLNDVTYLELNGPVAMK